MWPFNILGKLYVWENANSEVMTKNYISQSCLSVLTSVEIISQICLFVGLCVCLFLCVFHHFLRNDWIFFSKTLSIDFWGIAEVVTTIKKIHTCWLFLLIFVGYFTLLFFLRTLYNFLLKFYRNVLGITLMVTTHTKKIAAWHSLLLFILG